MKLVAFALVALAQVASAQSTGSMTSPQTGAASAGGGPVGVILPSSIQSASTAPTQPGHTITGDRPRAVRQAANTQSDRQLARSSASEEKK
jgi:hypothetical protein